MLKKLLHVFLLFLIITSSLLIPSLLYADSEKIAFYSNRDGNYEIYVMNSDGTGVTRLTNNAAEDSYPSFSADGTKIAFYSNRDGKDEIYVMNSDGTGVTRLTNNVAADYRPSWGVTASSSFTSRSRAAEEWVALNLNIQELKEHYGPTLNGFIDMLYDNSLHRVPDEPGRKYWVEMLNTNTFSANTIVEHFIFSDELNAEVSNMTNEAFMTFLYNALFARNPDNDGYIQWIEFMSGGNSKLDTLKAFLNNEEWINICNMFNVAP